MKLIKKLGIGCGAIIALGIISVASLALLLYVKKNKYDKIAIPFFEESMPALSSWEPNEFEKYWTEEVINSTDKEQLGRLFKTYSRLGKLLDYDTPQFLQVGANTNIPYSSYVNYSLTAEYENEEALISWTLVPIEEGVLKVWSMKINSNIFLDSIDNAEESQPNQPIEANVHNSSASPSETY